METIHGLNTNGPAIIGTGVAFTALAVLGVGLRFGSKRVARTAAGLDDWLLLAALLIYVVAEILVIRCECPSAHIFPILHHSNAILMKSRRTGSPS